MRILSLMAVLTFATVAVAQETPLVFSGAVRLPDERPAAGAQLWLVAAGQDQYPQPTVVATTTADAQGRFAFPATPALPGAWPTYCVCARAEGYALAWTDRLTRGDTALSLLLQPAFPLRGKITDSAGQPVAGLQPRLSFLEHDTGFDPLAFTYFGAACEPPAELSALLAPPTDAGGAFTLTGLPAGVYVSLSFDSPAYAHTRLNRDWATLMTGAPLAVTLPKPATLSGRVRRADGTPAAGLKIAALAQSAGSGVSWGPGSATTDDQGRYALTNLPPGAYQVYLNELPVEFTAPALLEVKVEEGATVEGADFQLERGIEITGRATDQATGAPLAGVGVCCNTAQQPAAGMGWPVVKTGDDGRYVLRAPAGPATLRPFGLPPGWRGVGKWGGDSRRFTLTTGETPPAVDFVFVRSTPLKGSLVDDQGRPVPGAHALYYANEDFGSRHNLIADERGEFSLDIRPDVTGVLLAYSGEALTTSPTVVPPGQTGPFVLRLTANARPSLTGRVVGDDGRPIPYAIVRVDSTVGDPAGGPYAHAFLIGTALADAAGRFTLRAVWPGAQLKLRLRAGGYSEHEGDLPALKTAEARDLGDITLPTADVVITGVVLDEKGKPVPGAVLDASRIGGQFSYRRMATTDTAGRFRLAELPREPVRIEADQFQFDGNDVTTTGKSQDVVMRVIRRRDQVLFTQKLDPPPTAEIRGVKYTLRAVYRFQTLSPRNEVGQYLALDLDPGGRAVTAADDQGKVLGAGPHLNVDNRYLPSVALPAAGAQALAEVRLSDASAAPQPTETLGPFSPQVPGAIPNMMLWFLGWQPDSLLPAGPTPAGPAPYLGARFYALATARWRYRLLGGVAGDDALRLLPVGEWTYDPATDTLTLPEALQPRERELRQEALGALATLRLGTPNLPEGALVQGFWLQSAGGHGNAPLPATATITREPYLLPTWSEVLARNVPLPPELTHSKTF
ncbi:MAG TPA: carboxypeptidase regulatory-like domain-containing protein [Armatimonadota bacterium]|jgi:hypothetical protein